MSSVTRTYFTLSVIDMARAVAFYRGVLGPVVRVESRPSGDYIVGLADGRELAGSRRYRRPLMTSAGPA